MTHCIEDHIQRAVVWDPHLKQRVVLLLHVPSHNAEEMTCVKTTMKDESRMYRELVETIQKRMVETMPVEGHS